MGEVLLLLVVALTVAAVVFGVTVLVSGRDPGLAPAEPDGRAVPLPGGRPLLEADVAEVRFDTALRGYRMAQVDQAMRRAAYDIGYKSELIGVLEAEVIALREGRTADADALRRAREEAAGPNPAVDTPPADAGPTSPTQETDARPADRDAAGRGAAGAADRDAAGSAGADGVTAAHRDAVTAHPDAAVAGREAGAEPVVALRPPADPVAVPESAPTAAAPVPPPTADAADEEDDRDRGPVVRSESA
ncbi:DivIVA domain-containing protein [Micromonospora coerulea]|uniref:DivIVA domain-containing protein n=1 Tax=Micromonospora coerulea TaxID=47856 RepID=UPI0019052287|nr:DivIVA domain-containing protein [Micromonospora veneta]